MSYRDNVQEVCDKLGIANSPINETDLTVATLKFLMTDDTVIEIPGSHMNRAGRLFFQAHVPPIEEVVVLNSGDTNFILAAESYFSERWENAESAGRSLITFLKRASQVKIVWKFCQ